MTPSLMYDYQVITLMMDWFCSVRLLRATVISLLDTFAGDDVSVVAEARRRFELHWTEPAALPAEYKVCGSLLSLSLLYLSVNPLLCCALWCLCLYKPYLMFQCILCVGRRRCTRLCSPTAPRHLLNTTRSCLPSVPPRTTRSANTPCSRSVRHQW